MIQYQIDVVNQGPRLQPVVGINKCATNQIQGGLIAGLVDAYALIDDTQKEIDALAEFYFQKNLMKLICQVWTLMEKKKTNVFSLKFKAVENQLTDLM